MEAVVHVLIRILEGMFVVGVIGSAVVWVLTTVEDVQNMFSRDAASAESITDDADHHAESR